MNTGRNKTKLMQRVEKERREPLEVLLPRLINAQGQTRTAEELEISKACLGYWILKLKLNVVTVVLAPGETLEIKRASGKERAA